MDPVTTYDMERYGQLALWWGSRILVAIVIIAVAHFIGKAIKSLLAKGVDKLPGASHHNTHYNKDGSPQGSVGAKLGDVGYWLVLLAGVIAALNVLELDGVVEPLNGMLSQFLDYLPRIVGAIVIFFVGYVVATLARRVVESLLAAADLDHWLDKLGLRRLTGTSGIAKTVGTIVFVLIIIPVAIAALTTLNIRAVSDPAVSMLNQILTAIPLIFTAAIILTIFYALGRWVASLIEQILPTLGFDNAVSGLLGGAGGSASPTMASSSTTPPEKMSSATFGLDAIAPPPPGVAPSTSGAATPAAAAKASAASMTPSKVVGSVAMIGIVLFGAVQAAHTLQFEPAVVMLSEILSLFSRILFGGVIILVGVMIAQLLSSILTKSGGQSGQFAGTIVKYAAIALAVAIGLRFMGLANEIVILAFGLILGSAAVAAAIAFGVGGRQTAGKLLERWTQGGTKP